MQLRRYLAILTRFWPLVALLPLVVGALTLSAALTRPLRYTATARLMVSQALPPGLAPPNLRDQWDGTEFLIDDIPQVVSSALFAQDVSATQIARDAGLGESAALGGLSAEIFHRTVTLRAVANRPEQANALALAAIETLRVNGLKYWGRSDASGESGIELAVIDAPVAASDRSLRQLATDVALRAGLGLAAGVGLAFLLHYLDTRLRSPRDVEELLGLPVVGTIPRE
jgi:capsular polysaccharide biosynthesis protein